MLNIKKVSLIVLLGVFACGLQASSPKVKTDSAHASASNSPVSSPKADASRLVAPMDLGFLAKCGNYCDKGIGYVSTSVCSAGASLTKPENRKNIYKAFAATAAVTGLVLAKDTKPIKDLRTQVGSVVSACKAKCTRK